MHMKPYSTFNLCFFIFFYFIYIQNSTAQKLATGPQVLTFHSDVDDTEQPYGLYLPKNFDEQKKYPLVIMLHGAGSNHRLALRRVFGKTNFEGENDVEASRYFPEWDDVEYIVASPYARGTAGYRGIPEKDVWDVVADVKRRFSIDEDRMYLTGLSMGGGGTLWIGLSRPDVWAAIAPVCPAPPKGTEDIAQNAYNLPVHFFHGDQDQAVPVTVSRDWVENLKNLGTKVEYKEYEGVNHDSWEPAYKDGFIFDWFGQFKRSLYPDEVKFASGQYKYGSAYWVKLDKLIPGKVAKLEARFSKTNTLEVKVTDLSAFTLKLADHPKYNSGEKLQLTINGKKVKTSDKDSISFVLNKDKWISGNINLKEGVKQKGAEGPIKEAFSDRHIYVYGTADNPSESELKQRVDLADQAATWSVYRGPFLGRMMIFPRVVADKDVRPSDIEDANLVLFGTKETNTLIQKYADKLPVHLTTPSKDHGLFYIFPLNGNYVAVNSGLPWWTSPKEPGFRFSTQPVGVLDDFKDFILFRGGLNEIVSEGWFNEDWELSESDKNALKASGVVELNP